MLLDIWIVAFEGLVCSLQPCDHRCKGTDLLAPLYALFSCVLSLSLMVS